MSPFPTQPPRYPSVRGARLALATLAVILTVTSAAAASEATTAVSLEDHFAPPELYVTGDLKLPELDAEIPEPAAVLGYALGERFTRYAEVRGYLRTLADASDRVAMWDYGTTYEERPLTLVAISSAENLARLDAIAGRRAALADPAGLSPEQRESLAREAPLVVWLAYGVHGNESASTEAALATAHTLAAAQGAAWDEIRRRVVVLLDPLSNPDGRERYVHAFQQRRGAVANPDPAAREHDEPWPGGRFNHYLIDLNRDWAWASQRETRHRLEALRHWQPQVYVDLHEMGSSQTYFFPPPADPVNPRIDAAVVRWLETFGRGNAAAFDKNRWLFYKAEDFDLFYPGYADSYTSFLGAVGMTYEVGGGGAAGLTLDQDGGTRLTLKDRLQRHWVASLATVATAATHADELLMDYVESRAERAAQAAAPTYLWSGAAGGDDLAHLLARHGLRVYRLSRGRDLDARPLRPATTTGAEAGTRQRRFPADTWVLPTAQPLGHLASALMEMHTPMGERFVEEQRRRVEAELYPAFYDVTAWSLPLAFDVEAWVGAGTPADLGEPLPAPPLERPSRPQEPEDLSHLLVRSETPAPPSGALAAVRGSGELGWMIPASGLGRYRVAAELHRENLLFRVLLADVTLGGMSYPAGSLFVPRSSPFDEPLVAEAGYLAGQEVHRVASSFTDSGPSLGSRQVPPVIFPRIGLVMGDGVSPASAGALWHLLDRELEIPHIVVEATGLSGRDPILDTLDVLVLPNGYRYGRLLDGEGGDALERWIRQGGVLVAVGGALDWLRQRELTAVTEWQPETDGLGAGEAADAGEDGAATSMQETVVEGPLDVPGAVVATAMRSGHPLTLGMTSAPPTLVTGERPLLATGRPQVDVLTVAGEDPVLAGLAWPESADRLAGSLLVASEAVGQGRVVSFAQEPGFRLFWRSTMPLFLNAVVFGPSILD